VHGETKFTREAFDLLKFMTEEKIYMTDTSINIDHLLYLNIVMTGLEVKEFEWVESFIIQFNELLIEEHREATYNLCYALLHFNLKQYERSLEYLNKVRRMESFFNLQINSLVLQNYYELNLYDSALAMIDSYKHYLSENADITMFNKTRTKNFLDVVNKLLKIKLKDDKEAVYKIDISLEMFKTILKKEWLLEKIEELKKTDEG